MIDSRKAAVKEYKERKVPRGVFAVRCTASGRIWVGSTPNLEAARNGIWFSLKHGSHRDHALQSDWNTCGEQALQYEVLEKLDDDVCELSVRDLLKEKQAAWTAQLSARTLLP